MPVPPRQLDLSRPPHSLLVPPQGEAGPQGDQGREGPVGIPGDPVGSCLGGGGGVFSPAGRLTAAHECKGGLSPLLTCGLLQGLPRGRSQRQEAEAAGATQLPWPPGTVLMEGSQRLPRHPAGSCRDIGLSEQTPASEWVRGAAAGDPGTPGDAPWPGGAGSPHAGDGILEAPGGTRGRGLLSSGNPGVSSWLEVDVGVSVHRSFRNSWMGHFPEAVLGEEMRVAAREAEGPTRPRPSVEPHPQHAGRALSSCRWPGGRCSRCLSPETPVGRSPRLARHAAVDLGRPPPRRAQEGATRWASRGRLPGLQGRVCAHPAGRRQWGTRGQHPGGPRAPGAPRSQRLGAPTSERQGSGSGRAWLVASSLFGGFSRGKKLGIGLLTKKEFKKPESSSDRSRAAQSAGALKMCWVGSSAGRRGRGPTWRPARWGTVLPRNSKWGPLGASSSQARGRVSTGRRSGASASPRR